MGMIPRELMLPRAGLIPTTEFIPAGQTMDPSVSVPTAIGTIPAATAAAEPELDPQGDRCRSKGLRVCPPRLLQPLTERVDRKLAHSLMFAFPTMTAPARRKCETMGASANAGIIANARDPAAVIMRSPVSMESLRRTGIPCSGREGSGPSVSAISRSMPSAIDSISGSNSITAFSPGPALFQRALRWMTSSHNSLQEISRRVRRLLSDPIIISMASPSNWELVSGSCRLSPETQPRTKKTPLPVEKR